MLKRIAIAVLVGGLAASGNARPDRNAFLNTRAGNLAQLIAQVRRDPQVMDRFKRHFGMSDAEVIAYLSTLSAKRLAKKETYIVYSVPPDGHIKAHVETFFPGMGYYADAVGTPILIAKCGNPLNLGPKTPSADNPVQAAVSDSELATRTLESPVEPGEEIVAANTILNPENPLEPVVETGGGRPIIIPTAAPIFSPWLLGLLGLGAIDWGGGSDTSTVVVPEPAGLAAIAIGASMILRKRRRKV